MRKIANSLNQLPDIGQKFEFGEVRKAEQKHKDKKMEISFHFDLPQDKQDLLQKRVESGEVLTIGELNTTFAPDPKEVYQLIEWLRANGFTKIRQSHDRLNVYATSSAENISKKLNCDVVVVSENEKEIVSMNGEITLPSQLSARITSVNGLQPFAVYKKKSQKTDTIQKYRPTANKADTYIKGKPPYTINEILGAYNGLGMTHSGLNQTIGILIDTAAYNSDMVKFWQANGIPNNLSRITVINVRNVTLPAPSGEESLDTQWTSGIARDAKIRVYCSGDLYFTSLDMALDRMFLDAGSDPTFRQVSISLGLGERFLSIGELNTQNTKYLRLRALGVNCFVSSGDSGSHEGGILQVSFPASNPNVVSVGGTTLSLTNLGAVSSEIAWSGSGGGNSVRYTKPIWQNSIPGVGRMVPDISGPADPRTGGYVVLSGYVYQVGGTSWSAPIWAGICALINDARIKAGKSRINFLPLLIYNQIGSIRFRDINRGKNGAYTSTVGYDKVTGIGVPNIKNLISYFVSLA